jgi:hypothetical protein
MLLKKKKSAGKSSGKTGRTAGKAVKKSVKKKPSSSKSGTTKSGSAKKKTSAVKSPLKTSRGKSASTKTSAKSKKTSGGRTTGKATAKTTVSKAGKTGKTTGSKTGKTTAKPSPAKSAGKKTSSGTAARKSSAAKAGKSSTKSSSKSSSRRASTKKNTEPGSHTYTVQGVRLPCRAYRGQLPYIFVSYAHKDMKQVFRLIKQLNDKRYRIWFDEGIEPGHEWPEIVGRAVVKCSQFIVFMSPWAARSRNVRNEINLAFSENRDILVVYLEPTNLSDGMKLQIGTVQFINRFDMSERECMKQITGVLKSSVKG